MQKRSENTRGITLIALVITIIVLLILAGVTINALSGDNGILKRATEAKQKTSQAQKDEEDALATMVDAINGAVPSQDGYSESKKVNSPKVTRGMIPVKWVSNNWVVCSEDDTEWYNYGSKQWANVMLSDGTYKADTVKVGQVVEEKDLELIDIVSGKTRRNSYPNGDVVINNTVLYCIRNYAGELRCDEESKEMKFFDLNNLPKNQNDSDLIEIYKKYKRK